MPLRLQIELGDGLLGALSDVAEREKLESVGEAAKLLLGEALSARGIGSMPAPLDTRGRSRRGSGFAGHPPRTKAGG